MISFDDEYDNDEDYDVDYDDDSDYDCDFNNDEYVCIYDAYYEYDSIQFIYIYILL